MPLRILLIDDDEDDFILTRALVEEFDRDDVILDRCNSSEEAQRLLNAGRHDVYLIDYRLGETDGLALLRAAIYAGNARPMILITGQGDPNVDVMAMRAGAMDYLVKGAIDAQLLERSIRYAVQRKKVESELAELQKRLADSREEQWLLIAQELHDGPLQDLIGAQFHLSVLSHPHREDAQEQLKVVQERLADAIVTLRSLCTDLRPPALVPFGLEQAIRAHVKRFAERHPEIAVDLDLDADHQLLPERTRLALFRIVQHALSNIADHAGATQVRISFQLKPNQVRLRVMDDGHGFHVPTRWIELAREGHLGLLGASERAEAIGGRLQVSSSPDVGTILTVVAPIKTSHTELGQ